jgi:hypothetical protein
MNIDDEFDMEYLQHSIYWEKPVSDYTRSMEASALIFSPKSYQDKLKELYKYMNKRFKYIDKFAKSKNHGRDVKMYSCEEFEKYNGGCCHDFSNYVYYTYHELKPAYNLIFINLRYAFIVHSYISFREKYLMEFICSNKGVTEFKDKRAMVNDMKEHLIHCFGFSQDDVIGIENYLTKPPNSSDSYMDYCANCKRKAMNKHQKYFDKKAVGSVKLKCFFR